MPQTQALATKSAAETRQNFAVSHPSAEGAHASVYCPVCSRRLEPERCKLVCSACGYYMSCSDYY